MERNAITAGVLAILAIVAGVFLFKGEGEKAYENQLLGLSFTYPETYVLEERADGESLATTTATTTAPLPFVRMITLTHQDDVRPVGGPAGEGPTAITILAYRNTGSLSAGEWVRLFRSTSNFDLSDGSLDVTTVDGEPAVRYAWSGLYEADNVVVVRPDYVFSFVGTYLSQDDEIRDDFEHILKSVEFADRVASSTATTTPPGSATSTKPPGGASGSSGDPDIVASGAAVEDLAEDLDIASEDVTVVSVTEKQWPNGCLGLAGAGEFCTQAIVPGFEVVLRAKGKNYIYRTNVSGSVLRAQ